MTRVATVFGHCLCFWPILPSFMWIPSRKMHVGGLATINCHLMQVIVTVKNDTPPRQYSCIVYRVLTAIMSTKKAITEVKWKIILYST